MSKVAVITGGGSGIGQATAHAFLDDGWSIALIGRRLEALEETASHGGDAHAFSCDVADAKAVETTFDQIATQFGRIDAVFNNAGINVAGNTIDEISVEDFRKVIDVNLTGSFLIARQAFKHMRAQSPQGGRIINNGSISAEMPRPGSVPYTCSKHAITGLTRTIALDGRPFSIACGQVDVGNAMSEMAAKMAIGVPQADGRIAAEPMMKVEEVGQAVLNMANLPLSTNILFQTIMATNMPFVGRG